MTKSEKLLLISGEFRTGMISQTGKDLSIEGEGYVDENSGGVGSGADVSERDECFGGSGGGGNVGLGCNDVVHGGLGSGG